MVKVRDKIELESGFGRETLRYGYVNNNGAWVVPPIYTEATSFAEGLAFATKDGKWIDLIDSEGRVLLTFERAVKFYGRPIGMRFMDGVAIKETQEGFYLDKNARFNFSNNLNPRVLGNGQGVYFQKGIFYMKDLNSHQVYSPRE